MFHFRSMYFVNFAAAQHKFCMKMRLWAATLPADGQLGSLDRRSLPPKVQVNGRTENASNRRFVFFTLCRSIKQMFCNVEIVLAQRPKLIQGFREKHRRMDETLSLLKYGRIIEKEPLMRL